MRFLRGKITDGLQHVGAISGAKADTVLTEESKSTIYVPFGAHYNDIWRHLCSGDSVIFWWKRQMMHWAGPCSSTRSACLPDLSHLPLMPPSRTLRQGTPANSSPSSLESHSGPSL